MKRTRKPSVIGVVFPILIAAMVVMIAACEWTITVSGDELRSRALETCRAEVGYISDALYSQLTEIQLRNVEILNSDSVLALAMRSSIMDRYETIAGESAVMKQIRSGLSRLNLVDVSARLYIPAIGTVITAQKASAASEEEKDEIVEIVRDFPNGLYCTDGHMGFWSASPLVRDPSRALESRVMLTQVRRDSLRSLLKRYASHSGDTQLFLIFGSRVIASSRDAAWDEGIFADPGEEVKTVDAADGRYYVIRADHPSSGLAIAAALPADSVMSNLYRLRRMLRTLEIICVLIYRAAGGVRVLPGGLQAPQGHVRGHAEDGRGGPVRKDAPRKDRGAGRRRLHLQRHGGEAGEPDRKGVQGAPARGRRRKESQYQISPHFLYNAYFQLRSLILLEENEQAQRLADLMGRYLRYIVRQDPLVKLSNCRFMSISSDWPTGRQDRHDRPLEITKRFPKISKQSSE